MEKHDKGANAWRYGPAGVEFGLTVTAFAVFGVWLDRRLGWSAAATIASTLAGFVVALWRLLRRVKELASDHDRKSS
ncbi:MAG: AtpZ/AtpI family protein [Planctomycetaceae bacterium]|nr:AtpZ/AtpI family protein [Planctomycetaceae bacterium]